MTIVSSLFINLKNHIFSYHMLCLGIKADTLNSEEYHSPEVWNPKARAGKISNQWQQCALYSEKGLSFRINAFKISSARGVLLFWRHKS